MGQSFIGIHMPFDNVDEIQVAGIGENFGNFHAFLKFNSSMQIFVNYHANSHDVVAADLISDLINHLQSKSKSIFEAAAILVTTSIGER